MKSYSKNNKILRTQKFIWTLNCTIVFFFQEITIVFSRQGFLLNRINSSFLPSAGSPASLKVATASVSCTRKPRWSAVYLTWKSSPLGAVQEYSPFTALPGLPSCSTSMLSVEKSTMSLPGRDSTTATAPHSSRQICAGTGYISAKKNVQKITAHKENGDNNPKR